LLVIDFVREGDIEKFFEKLSEGSHAHTVAHKHGLLISIKKCFFYYLTSTGFSSEQMLAMFNAAGLHNPQVEVN
jgi:hypothetical protein